MRTTKVVRLGGGLGVTGEQRLEGGEGRLQEHQGR